MSKQPSTEATIPIGIVLMTVGMIVAATAVASYLLLTMKPTQQTQLVATLPPAVTATSTAVVDDLVLLPESPTDEQPSDNTVSLSEVAQTYIVGQPERLLIPTIDLDAPVSGIGLAQVQNSGQTYYQWQVPNEFRAGWHNTSAPLGRAGNTVLNGHHNINGEVFRHLVDLKIGAEIVVYDRENAYSYVVAQVEILPERGQPLEIRKANARWIAPTEDERLTLITCWPYEDNSHRVVVVAYPADSADAVSPETIQ